MLSLLTLSSSFETLNNWVTPKNKVTFVIGIAPSGCHMYPKHLEDQGT